MKKELKHLYPQLNVFLVCLLISAVLWIVIKLSQPHSSEITYSLYYRHPKGMAVIQQPPATLHARVSAVGFDIIRYRLASRHPSLFVNIQEGDLRKHTIGYTCTIGPEALRYSLRAHLLSGITILSFQPDSLIVWYDDLDSIRMAIEPDITLNFRYPNRLYSEPVVKPDSVMLYGSKNELTRISKVTTVAYVGKDLDEDVNLRLPLLIIPEGLNIGTDVQDVNLTLAIRKFTEGSVMVPVSLLELPASQKLRIYTGHVSVKFLAEFEEYKKITPDMFEVIPDTSGMFQPERKRLNLIVARKPAGIEITGLEPSSVEFILLD